MTSELILKDVVLTELKKETGAAEETVPPPKVDDLEGAILTIEWLSSPNSNGGITTCAKHRGIGFASDCAICYRLKEIKTHRLGK